MTFPEQYRYRDTGGRFESKHGDHFGIFYIPDGADRLSCLATDGYDLDKPLDAAEWEHVSVTVRNRRGVRLQRCATWAQMCLVKEAFWDTSECVVQFHPPKSDYVNTHPFCLHLWRNSQVEFPRPPHIYV